MSLIESSHVVKKSIMEEYSDYLISDKKIPSKAKTYVCLVRKFHNFIGKPYLDIIRNDIYSYIFYLVEKEELSEDYIIKNLTAIKVFYEYLLKRGYIYKVPSEGISLKNIKIKHKKKNK